MTVHFFYNYKEELLKQLSERYKTELEEREQRLKDEEQLGEAIKLIKEFFDDMIKDLEIYEEVSGGKIKFSSEDNKIAYLEIFRNYIKFSRVENTIEIKIGEYNEKEDLVESAVYAYITPGEKKCKIKKVGKLHDGSHFDENTINTYVRKAFAKIFE